MARTITPSADQVVVISGAGSGIGRETALYLNELGYTIAAGVRGDAQVADLRTAASAPDRMVPIQFDVTDDAQVAAAVGAVEDLLTGGRHLRGVFSNAGIAATDDDTSVEGTPMASLERITAINYLGAARFVRAFLPLLRQSRGTVVLNTAMMARIVLPYNGGYAASKAALETWGITLRREIAQHGVHVVFVELAGIATSLTHHDARPKRGNPLYPQAAVIDDQFAAMSREAQRHNPAVDPRRAAELVAAALSAQRPRQRYIGGEGARPLWLAAHLPPRLQDAAMTRGLDLALTRLRQRPQNAQERPE